MHHVQIEPESVLDDPDYDRYPLRSYFEPVLWYNPKELVHMNIFPAPMGSKCDPGWKAMTTPGSLPSGFLQPTARHNFCGIEWLFKSLSKIGVPFVVYFNAIAATS